MTTRPIVGQRDARHRVFIGWKIRCGEFELDPCGHWYNVAGEWTDRKKAVAAIKKERLVEIVVPIALVPVWRKEGRWRRALRELCEAYEWRIPFIGSPPALDRARKLLGS